MSVPEPTVAGDPTLVAITLARIEGKIDRMSDRVDSSAREIADHEVRLRSLENRSVVTPKTLGTTLTVIGAIVTAAAAVAGLVIG